MADQTMAAEREASVALVGPFTLRDVIVAVSVALLFLASVLPTAVVRGIGLNAWNSAGLFQLALSILLPAAVLVLFVIRRIAPKTKLRIGSLSVDQFASVAASFATAFYFLVMVNVFSIGAVVGFLGSLGLLTATVFAPWIPGFASDFAGRHEIPAHPVARDAVPARPKSAQPAGAAARKETNQAPVGSAVAAAPGASAAAAPAASADKAAGAAGAVAGAGATTAVTGTGAAAAGPSGETTGATAGPAAAAAKEPRKTAGKAPAAPSAATGPAADAVAPGAADGEAMGLPDTEHAIADAARAAELKGRPAAAVSGPAAAGTGPARQGAAAAAGTDRAAQQQAAAQAGGAAKTGMAVGAAAATAAGAAQAVQQKQQPEAATAGAAQAVQQKQQPEAATAGAAQAVQQKQQPEAATAGVAQARPAPAEAAAPLRDSARDSGRGTPAGAEPAAAAASGTPAGGTTGTNQAATVAIDTVAAGPARDEPISATREAAAEPEEAVYEAFWFAVGRTRAVFDENTGAPVFTLEPGAWILALQDRGDEFLVQHTDGRVGVLRDLTNIERA